MEDLLMARKRKSITYHLDELVWESIKVRASEEGSSANRWLENHLFDYFKSIGIISDDEVRIAENRGGSRKPTE